MLAADGGGGTNWSSMNVEQMQALIQNPDTTKYYELLTGWTQSHQLIIDHMSQVQGYRDSLAAVWPPEKSAASAAYLARLDELIANLNETYEAALTNHDAFAAATLSIGLAQHDMQKIHDEYQSNQQLLTAFKTQQEQKQNSSTPMPTPSPSGEEPPVAPGRQEELRQQAIKLMSGVSSDLVQSQFRIVKPTPYEPGTRIEEGGKPNDGTTYVAPPIPPITPVQTGGGSGAASHASEVPSATFPTGAGSAPGPTSSVTAQPGVNQPGLVLGGTTPPVISSPAITSPGTGLVTPTLPTGGSGPVPNPGILPPGTNAFLPDGGASTNAGLNRGLTPPLGEGVVRPNTGIRQGIRPMPPGGLIGGTPGIGLGQPGAARPSTRRINPVGGVIGDGEPGARAGGVRGVGGYGAEGMVGGGRSSVAPGRGAGITGRAISASERRDSLGGRSMSAGDHPGAVGGRGTFAEQSFGSAGSRRGNRRPQSEDSQWDPDNPWETEEGVAPVVLPPREQRIDPGPAIGLS
jgi:hypothetical protein